MLTRKFDRPRPVGPAHIGMDCGDTVEDRDRVLPHLRHRPLAGRVRPPTPSAERITDTGTFAPIVRSTAHRGAPSSFLLDRPKDRSPDVTELPTWRNRLRRSGDGGHQYLRAFSLGTEGFRLRAGQPSPAWSAASRRPATSTASATSATRPPCPPPSRSLCSNRSNVSNWFGKGDLGCYIDPAKGARTRDRNSVGVVPVRW